MGMYDDIIDFSMKCPNCGATVSEFQSKDGPCILAGLSFKDVDNFYSYCPDCHAWIEINYADDRKKRTLRDYEITYEQPDKKGD